MTNPDSASTVFRTQRVLPVAPSVVYQAFSDPARLARWWGPTGFTNSFQVFEFRPGGRWEFVMHGPDGRDYTNASVFQSLEPSEHVVIEHVSPPAFTLTVTLSPQGQGTALTWAQDFGDAALAARLAPIVVPANEQNLDRLAALLAHA